MSTKRILSITIFGLFLIAFEIGAMLLSSNIRRDSAAIQLPDTPMIVERLSETEPDALSRVEINRDTVQAVVSTLARPEIYSRDVVIESFWEGGQAVFNISVAVKHSATSLSITPPSGQEKRIIITPDKLYIWHAGDDVVFAGSPNSMGDGIRTADEWQMLNTFENILGLSGNDIIDAGYAYFGGEMCVFALYRSPQLGNLRKYYISLDLGLVIAALEHDSRGMLIYTMTAGNTFIGEVNPEAFRLPDGTEVIDF